MGWALGAFVVVVVGVFVGVVVVVVADVTRKRGGSIACMSARKEETLAPCYAFCLRFANPFPHTTSSHFHFYLYPPFRALTEPTPTTPCL